MGRRSEDRDGTASEALERGGEQLHTVLLGADYGRSDARERRSGADRRLGGGHECPSIRARFSVRATAPEPA